MTTRLHPAADFFDLAGRPSYTGWTIAPVRRLSCILVLLIGLATASAARAERVNVCGSVATDTVWTAGNVYVIDSCTVTVEPGVTLRIEPGTVVKLWYWDWKLRVRGTLQAEGTAETPVLFTSLRDDTIGGDTNGDGTATTPAAGNWGLIDFAPGSSGRLSNVTVRYGGWFSGFGLRAMLEARGASNVTLDHVTIASSAAEGIFAQDNSLAVAACRFAGNAGTGLVLDGLRSDAPTAITDTVFETKGPNGHAAYIRLGDHPDRITLARNQASGTGRNGIQITGDVIRDLALDVQASIPMLIVDTARLQVTQDATLTISPGTIFKLGYWDWKLRVYGTLLAQGTSEAPIVFTSLLDDEAGGDTNGDGDATAAGPGNWGLIAFEAGSRGRLRDVDVRYGGYFSGAGLRGMVEARGTNDVVLEQVSIRHSAVDGIYAENASVLVQGVVAANTFGIRNGTPGKGLVDARHTWWEAQSGPLHRTKNPNGAGNEVSDGVLFFPWATDEDGTEPTQVLLSGPTRVSPGDTVEYAASYYAGGPIEDAVLAFSLPRGGVFVDATGGGLYWSQKSQIVWKLGDLPQGAEGVVATRVRYVWGLADNSAYSAVAILDGSNVDLGPIDLDIASYLGFEPPSAQSERTLTQAEIEQELQTSEEVRAFYQDAIASGAWPAGGLAYTLSGGDSEVVSLILGAPIRADIISRQNQFVVGSRRESMWQTIRDSAGGMTLDLPRLAFQAWGTWAGESVAPATGQAAGTKATWVPSQCMYNCLVQEHIGGDWDMIDSIGFDNLRLLETPECRSCQQTGLCAQCVQRLKRMMPTSGVLDIGEIMTECKRTCFERACLSDGKDCTTKGSEACDEADCMQVDTRSQYGCEASGTDELQLCVHSGRSSPSTGQGFPVVAVFHCDRESGLWVLQDRFLECPVYSHCHQGPFDVLCLGGSNCLEDGQRPKLPEEMRLHGAVPLVSPGDAPMVGKRGAVARAQVGEVQPPTNCSLAPTTVRVARDPNAKFGPTGDVVPGQVMTYTVEFENVGEGRAYDVYVLDGLSPSLDETTVDLGGQGTYLPSIRTIRWDVGTLEPNGQPGSKGQRSFSVRLRTGLVSGTVITNQAVVYFPSVPEETPTNWVVNVVQPLAAIPQSVQTSYGQPVAITLTGRDVSGTPLIYAVKESPLNGVLTGTPPTVTYTPGENFTGQDRFAFTVSNGVSESRPGDVTIVVTPSAADTVIPEVRWVYPAASGIVSASLQPVSSDGSGPLYGPSVLSGFSELLDPATLTPQTFTVTNALGEPVAASVAWDGTLDEAVLSPRQPMRPGNYTARVGQTITDASGNPLGADYAWNFTVARPCIGDCTPDKAVAVNELLIGVNIAMGSAEPGLCPAFQADDDPTKVSVAELVDGLSAALYGCL